MMSNKEVTKLLTVLDMSEEEQKSWCWVNIENEQYYTSRRRDISLADLAFRLSGGKIASKKPIEYIIDALLAKESK